MYRLSSECDASKYGHFTNFDGFIGSLTSLPLFVLNSKLCIVYYNQPFEALLEQQKFKSTIPGCKVDETLPFINEPLMNQIETIVGFNDQKRLVDSNYSIEENIGNWDITVTPFFHTDDNLYLTGILKSANPVEKKHSFEKWMKTMPEYENDYMLITDTYNRVLAANASLKAMIGVDTDKEIIGIPEKNLLTGNMEENGIVFLHTDVRKPMRLLKEFPVFDSNGETEAIIKIFRDPVVEPLQDNEPGKYRLLIENQGVGIAILDNQHKFTFANKICSDIFECPIEDLKGMMINNFLTGSNKAKFVLEIEKRLDGWSGSFSLQIRLKNGKKKYIVITATPYLSDTKVIGSFVNFRDITAEKIAEKRLRMSERQLRQLNATKDKFFSIIAHDLKNPFGSIMGFSNLILKKTIENDTEKIAQYAEIIRNASENGYELLESLLEWSRAQKGNMKYNPVSISLATLINHNIGICYDLAKAKSINIRSTLKNKFKVFIDEDMINTVLRNLITNAIKFTTEGKNIVVSASPQNDGTAIVSVADEGIGIEPADCKRLFKIQHSYTTKGTAGEAGTGLGLLLCKEFVEKNKGKIWVESVLAKGSTFSFSVPLSPR